MTSSLRPPPRVAHASTPGPKHACVNINAIADGCGHVSEDLSAVCVYWIHTQPT